MRRLFAAAIVIVSLALAVTAIAAVPNGDKNYKGTTSLPKFGKFKDPVTFKTANNGQLVTKFQFGFLSCQGSGGPPPTKNPYTQPGNVIQYGNMGIAGSGKFSGLGFHTVNGVKTTASLHGKFKKRKKRIIATGTISVKQTFSGGKCGPVKVTFSANPK